MIKKHFQEHPASVDETYGQHMLSALCFSGAFLWAAFAVMVHAFLPFLFTTTGRDTIQSLHQRMIIKRS